MSKHNRVNKTNYDQRGRLTPDELAREQAKQIEVSGAQRRLSERAREARAARGEREPIPGRNARAKQE